MITKLIMLRLIITLAVCAVLVSAEHSSSSGQNQNLPSDGKDTGPKVASVEEDLTTRCIVCNSKLQDGCDDKFDLENTLYTNHSMLCADYFKNSPVTLPELDLSNKTKNGANPPPGTKFFCTKAIMTFEFPDAHEDARIVRQCSFQPGRYGWAGCYYTANSLYSTTVCKCSDENKAGEEKGCNSATSVASSLLLLVIGLVMLR